MGSFIRATLLLAEEEVRRYLLDVRERNARGSFKTSHYGIQFFYLDGATSF